MSGDDIDLDEMLGPDPLVEEEPEENVVDAAPKSRPMGEASRALLERSRTYPVIPRSAKKLQPERLLRLLNCAVEMPVVSDVCARCAISTTTLKIWLQRSKEGAPGDQFDVRLEGEEDEEPVRFHEAWEMAMVAGVEKVERVTIQRATGYLEPQTYRGRVQYKYDPRKCQIARELGLEEFVPENYLLDAIGAPIPETIEKMDPDLAMFILKTRKADVYSPKAQLDVNVTHGVLVVGQPQKNPADLNKIEQAYRMSQRSVVEFEDSGED